MCNKIVQHTKDNYLLSEIVNVRSVPPGYTGALVIVSDACKLRRKRWLLWISVYFFNRANH
jgi:hypothetical protein